jgi:hypothetical protein
MTDVDALLSISPSVYIAITGLRAYNRCGNLGEVLLVDERCVCVVLTKRQPILSTTVGFDAEEISTEVLPYVYTICPNGDSYKNLRVRRMNWSELLQDCSANIPNYYYNSADPFNVLYQQLGATLSGNIAFIPFS